MTIDFFLAVSAAQRVAPKVEPTYRLEPKEKFPAHKVEQILRRVMPRYFEGVTYDPQTVGDQAKYLCNLVKSELKALRCQRYRYLVTAVIGERQRGNEVKIASRCVWDDQHDAYTTFSFENQSLFACVTAFAILSE